MPSSHIRSPLHLRVSRPGKKISSPRLLLGPWWFLASFLACVSAVAGWALVAGITVMGWMSEIQSGFSGALRTGTQIWLLAHGVTAELAGLRVSLTPLLLTLGIWLLAHGATGVVVRQYKLRYDSYSALTAIAKIVVTVTICYAIVAIFITVLLAAAKQIIPVVIAASALAGSASLVGAARGFEYYFWRSIPAGFKAILRAALAACSVVLLGGTIALLAGFILHWNQVMTLAKALDMPVFGVIVLVIFHLLYLPTMLLWSSSWVLGGGITLGPDTVVSLVNNHLGILPGIPALGILPNNGPVSMFMLCWLLVGVVAGVTAARVIAREYADASIEKVSLLSGFAGVFAALVVVICAALSRGNLGNEQLVALGPRLGELCIMASGVIGLSAAVAGLVFSLRSHRR